MWKCEKCEEEHEDQFASCWKCAEVPKESIYGPVIENLYKTEGEATSLDDKLAAAYTCPKCSSVGALPKRVRLENAGWGMFLPSCVYLGLSCLKCGFAEFYDTEMLDRPFLFGDK